MTIQDNNEDSKDDKIKDKRLYRIGDTTRIGTEIFGIYASTISYILYSGENGQLSWEIEEGNEYTNQILSEAKRILTLAASTLTANRIQIVNRMISDIISSSLSSSSFQFTEHLFDDVDNYISKHKDELISVISVGPLFSIYRVKNDLIQWSHRKLPESCRKAVEDFNTLQSLSTTVLPQSYRKSVSRLLSASLSNVFRQDGGGECSDPFEKPRFFIYSQIENYLKIKIFYVSLITTALMLIILWCSYLYFRTGEVYFSAASAGILGVMVSALQRNNKLAIDPYTSPLGLYSEGISRVFIGVVFGLFIVFCANSELALAPFRENIYALCCFAFIAGFSERFVPDLMSTVAGKSSNLS